MYLTSECVTMKKVILTLAYVFIGKPRNISATHLKMLLLKYLLDMMVLSTCEVLSVTNCLCPEYVMVHTKEFIMFP